MYTEVYMDILNRCNALCYYCRTGQTNLQGKTNDTPFYQMDTETFARMAEHMRSHGIITPDCLFRIYNWYEPTLNPNLPDIMNYLYDEGYRLDMSTNASQVPDYSRVKSCENFTGLLFSMPGFSQASYDRIHHFNLETIKENIRQTVKQVRDKGFTGDAYINYHLYQFNIGEVRAAKEFADELGIRLHTMYAYFNGGGGRGGLDYVKGTIDRDLLLRASKDLFFHFLQELWDNEEKYTKDFWEPESITLSEHCNLIPGRGSNDEERIVSIFDMHSYEDVKAVYDGLQARERDPDMKKVYLWCHSYKRPMNHLFGF